MPTLREESEKMDSDHEKELTDIGRRLLHETTGNTDPNYQWSRGFIWSRELKQRLIDVVFDYNTKLITFVNKHSKPELSKPVPTREDTERMLNIDANIEYYTNKVLKLGRDQQFEYEQARKPVQAFSWDSPSTWVTSKTEARIKKEPYSVFRPSTWGGRRRTNKRSRRNRRKSRRHTRYSY